MIQTFLVYFFSTEINLLICDGHKIATLAITIQSFVVGEIDRKKINKSYKCVVFLDNCKIHNL